MKQILKDMENCLQTQGQTVAQHGIAVRDRLIDLISYLNGKETSMEWRIPKWVDEYSTQLLNDLPDKETLDLYTVYHDCGKPYCLEIDSDGKRHFPNHAKVSADVFKKHFNNDIAAHLIEHDMDAHLLKSEGVEAFSKIPYCSTLLLTALAEIHANSEMFGGIDSTSFKIKWKNLDKRGSQVCRLIYS